MKYNEFNAVMEKCNILVEDNTHQIKLYDESTQHLIGMVSTIHIGHIETKNLTNYKDKEDIAIIMEAIMELTLTDIDDRGTVEASI